MKYLFVIGHATPRADCTAHTLARLAVEAVKAKGHEAQIIDLIKEGFDKVATENDFVDHGGSGRFNYISSQSPTNMAPEILALQEKFVWCDNLIIIAPIWFYRLPACVSAMIERAFTNNWGFTEDDSKKLPCSGKHAMVAFSALAPHEFYLPNGPCGSMEALLFQTTYPLSNAGFIVHYSAPFYSVDVSNPTGGEDKWEKCVLNMRDRKVLPFDAKTPLAKFTEIDTIPL